MTISPRGDITPPGGLSQIGPFAAPDADYNPLPRTEIVWKNPQGNTVSCRPSGGGCTTHNDYSANGSLIAATHEFYIAGQQRVSGTYTAVASYCYPDPWTHTCYYMTEMFRANFYIGPAIASRISLPLMMR